VLGHLLGQSYSRQDMGFYGLALMAALLVTALPATASARKWLLLLLAASLAAERCAGRLLGSGLGLDVGRRLLLPQLLEMQPEGLSIDYIWALRWCGPGPHGLQRCPAALVLPEPGPQCSLGAGQGAEQCGAVQGVCGGGVAAAAARSAGLQEAGCSGA
jgi:hypothetical protein